jgi:hypothetical protein
MMLTREQAAETWCPMVRVARHEVIRIEGATIGGLTPVHEEHHVVGGCNTVQSPERAQETSCIADKCAMWRWLPLDTSDPLDPAPPHRGYCGLAGAPLMGAAS